MPTAFVLIIFTLTTVVTAESLGCPPDMFDINAGARCVPVTCPGECIDIFTCCAKFCFPRNITTNLVETCNIEMKTSLKTCSKHLEEMSCISGLTNSTPTVCHEQMKWMKREGLESFAPANIDNCPCERNYTLLESYCSFGICRDTTDCFNTTDPFYNTDVCCYSNKLNPTDDICNDGDEVVTIVQSRELEQCNKTCYDQGTTCRTSNNTFSACCRLKQAYTVTNEDKKSTIEVAADGFVVGLIVAFIVMFLAGCVTIGICVYRRKFLKKHVDDKTRVLGIGGIEEDINEDEDWTNISGTDGIIHAIEEEDYLDNEAEVGSFETTAVVNQGMVNREDDTPPMEDHRLSSDESNDLQADASQDFQNLDSSIKRSVISHDADDTDDEDKSSKVTDRKQNSIAVVTVLHKSQTDPNIPISSTPSGISSRKRTQSLISQSMKGDKHNFVTCDIEADKLDCDIYQFNDDMDTREIVITKPINKHLRETTTTVHNHRRDHNDRSKFRRNSTDANSEFGNNSGNEVPQNKDIEKAMSESQETSFSLHRSATSPNIHRTHKLRNVGQLQDVYKRNENCNNDFDFELETYKSTETVEEESDDSGVLNSSFSSSSGINIAANSSKEFTETRNLRPTMPFSAAIGGANGGQQNNGFTDID